VDQAIGKIKVMTTIKNRETYTMAFGLILDWTNWEPGEKPSGFPFCISKKRPKLFGRFIEFQLKKHEGFV
jgi:hypothetical protein